MESEIYQGFAEVYDEIMDNIPYESWADSIAKLFANQGVSGGQVCELGCGTGILTEMLAQRGYEMTGIDLSMEMLQKAMEKRMQSGLNINYVLQDMRQFELHHPVDAVICVCDSMNYLTEEEDLLQVFLRVKKYLKKDGIFLFDMKTRYCYENIMGNQTWTNETENCFYVWENYFDPEENINEYDLTIFTREGESNLYRRDEEYHYQRAYEIQTVKDNLEKAGLKCTQMFGREIGKELGEQDERIYFVIGLNEKGKSE
jgi:ubiquinone/menaquinone biosynthesis C-methylase UbiE